MENTPTQVTNTSPASIGKLALALSSAQGQMKGAIKDAENPFFKSSYANLASVWEACRKALSDNELSVAQIVDANESGMFLRTMLMHSSGECLSGVMPINFSEKTNAQQIGSIITYYRRYALSAIVGVAPEDDDGNNASQVTLESPAAKWAKTDPSLNALKSSAKDFVREIEMAESLGEFNRLVEKNLDLLKQLEKLPDWLKRAQEKIAQCREAFALS